MEHKDADCTCEGKVCSRCKECKCIRVFPTYKNDNGELRFRTICRPCVNQTSYAWAKANPDKVKAMRERYEENRSPEKTEKNMLRRRENSKKWLKEHPERVKKYKAKWRSENKEKNREYNRQWRKRNPHYDKNNRRMYRYIHSLDPVKLEQFRMERRIYARNYYARYRDIKGLSNKSGRTSNRWKGWKTRYPDRYRSSKIKSNYLRRAKLKISEFSYTYPEWQALVNQYDHTCLCCGRREPDIKLTVDHVIPISLGGSNSIDNIQPLCQSCNSKKRAKHIDFRPKKA